MKSSLFGLSCVCAALVIAETSAVHADATMQASSSTPVLRLVPEMGRLGLDYLGGLGVECEGAPMPSAHTWVKLHDDIVAQIGRDTVASLTYSREPRMETYRVPSPWPLTSLEPVYCGGHYVVYETKLDTLPAPPAVVRHLTAYVVVDIERAWKPIDIVLTIRGARFE